MINLKKKFFVILFLINCISCNSYALTDALIGTVGNKPFTHSDLLNEMKMILILNGVSFSESKKEELKASALKSITERLIKEVELNKYKYTQYNKSDVENEIKNIIKNLNIDINTFKEYFKSANVSISILEKRIETELKWNGLIFDLYKNKVKINLKDIDKKLKEIEKKSVLDEYLLSEILIDSVVTEQVDEKVQLIMNEINTFGFKNTAIKFSKSKSSLSGGELGWVKESAISEKFKKIIKETDVGKVSKPLLMPEGIMFLKVEKIRQVKNNIDLEKTKNKLLSLAKEKKLNMYAMSHFSKIKKNTPIIYNF